MKPLGDPVVLALVALNLGALAAFVITEIRTCLEITLPEPEQPREDPAVSELLRVLEGIDTGAEDVLGTELPEAAVPCRGFANPPAAQDAT